MQKRYGLLREDVHLIYAGKDKHVFIGMNPMIFLVVSKFQTAEENMSHIVNLHNADEDHITFAVNIVYLCQE